jgi:hypothetical protein
VATTSLKIRPLLVFGAEHAAMVVEAVARAVSEAQQERLSARSPELRNQSDITGYTRAVPVSKGTTELGYTNRNGQVVIEATDLPGNDYLQKVYVLRCGRCGTEYGANGSDIFQRRCPGCQGGAPGLSYA